MIGLMMVASHVVWLAHSDHQADVISGFGVSTAVIGILVAAQPFIREGVQDAARRQVGLTPQDMAEEELEQVAEGEAVRHVLKERVFGAVLIAIGTLLNGYAPALACLLSLPV